MDDLRKNGKGLRIEELRYEKYRDQPFKTPSGKIEFYSCRLAEAGFSGVPFAQGLGPNPISFAEQSAAYPVLGISGARDIRFTNSQYRTIPFLLKAGAGAVVDIHPEDARSQGFAEGVITSYSIHYTKLYE